MIGYPSRIHAASDMLTGRVSTAAEMRVRMCSERPSSPSASATSPVRFRWPLTSALVLYLLMYSVSLSVVAICTLLWPTQERSTAGIVDDTQACSLPGRNICQRRQLSSSYAAP